MSIRLFHRGARLVFVVRRAAIGDQRWWSPHVAPPDWGAIFSSHLALLGLPAELWPGGGRMSCRLGEIDWTAGRRWSIVALHLTIGSNTKRRLVAAALLKAARYARCVRVISKEETWPA